MTENEIRKRAIEGLEKVLNDIVDGYITNPNAACNSIADATALLKKQEPVEPTLRGGIGGYWYCGACNYQISRGDKFCRYCGQEVKWG